MQSQVLSLIHHFKVTSAVQPTAAVLGELCPPLEIIPPRAFCFLLVQGLNSEDWGFSASAGLSSRISFLVLTERIITLFFCLWIFRSDSRRCHPLDIPPGARLSASSWRETLRFDTSVNRFACGVDHPLPSPLFPPPPSLVLSIVCTHSYCIFKHILHA